MNKPNPLVSILLPVTNGADNLSETLESIISQSYENFEVIAVDDESKDQSLKILNKFRSIDKRIKVYKNNNRAGLRKTLNKAISKARGELIAFMPQDGKNYKSRIEKQVNFLLKNPDISAVGAQLAFVTPGNKVVAKSDFPTEEAKIERDLVIGNNFEFGSFMINRRLLPKDLLLFDHDELPGLFSVVFMKIFKYSKVAMMNEALVFKKISDNTSKRMIQVSNILSSFRASIKAFLVHDYRPSIRSILTL